MPIEHTPITEDSDLETIERFLDLYDSVMMEGTTINSIQPWYAFDRGKGILTQGVGPCVALATDDFLAHIPADKLPMTIDSQETGFLLLVKDLQDKGVRKVDLFSNSTSRSIKEMKLIKGLLEKAGFEVDIHINEDQSKAWTIIIKDKEIHAFVQ